MRSRAATTAFEENNAPGHDENDESRSGGRIEFRNRASLPGSPTSLSSRTPCLAFGLPSRSAGLSLLRRRGALAVGTTVLGRSLRGEKEKCGGHCEAHHEIKKHVATLLLPHPRSNAQMSH